MAQVAADIQQLSQQYGFELRDLEVEHARLQNEHWHLTQELQQVHKGDPTKIFTNI